MAWLAYPLGTDSAEVRSFPAVARAYAEMLAMVGAATLVGTLLAPRWGSGAVDLIYLLPVLAAASLYGLGPGLTAAILSALAFNFFFTAPHHTFRIASPADVVTVLMLLAVALVTSRLAAAMRAQARLAAANAARNAAIAGFAGELLSRSSREEIAELACTRLGGLFDCQAVLMVHEGGDDAEAIARFPASAPLTPADIATASWALEHGQGAGRGTPRLSTAEWRFFPVKVGARVLAAVGLARDDGRPAVTEEHAALLDSLLDQIALALERVALELEARDVAELRERDRLRGALLSSVGHDLRTPLTAIAAAAAELRRAPAADSELVATLEGETEKLGRYITNLLDMARIEAGAVRVRAEPVDLTDAVAASTGDLKRGLAGREVTIELPPDLPLVRADPDLLHHVLINVIANAALHSPADAPITIAAAMAGAEVELVVADEGPGLAADGTAALDRFSRIEGSDRKGGSGLGLAIVKSFSAAMGLRPEPRQRNGGGTMFALVFPAALVVPQVMEVDG